MIFNINSSDRAWAEEARARFPCLTSYGFGLPDQCSDSWGTTLTDEDVSQIIASRDFLSGFEINSGVYSNSPTASQLKSLLMGYSNTYVYEGAIVLAASALGLPIKHIDYAYSRIGLSRKSVKALRAMIDYRRKHSR